MENIIFLEIVILRHYSKYNSPNGIVSTMICSPSFTLEIAASRAFSAIFFIETVELGPIAGLCQVIEQTKSVVVIAIRWPKCF